MRSCLIARMALIGLDQVFYGMNAWTFCAGVYGLKAVPSGD
jgi:hypothetical protein